MRSIRSRLAMLTPALIAVVAAGLIREGQKWV